MTGENSVADLERAYETIRRGLLQLTEYDKERQTEPSARLIATARGLVADIELERERLKIGSEP